MKPGIYKNLPINEYHSSKGLSASGAKQLLDNPSKFLRKYLMQFKPKEESRCFIFGRAFHKICLEGFSEFSKEFYIMDNVDRRTKEGKELYKKMEEDNKGKTILTSKEYDDILGMKIVVDDMGYKFNDVEQSIYFEKEGFLLKSRPDSINEDFVGDITLYEIKTCSNCDTKSFERDFISYGYHIQAAMAIDGIISLGKNALKYIVLAIEKSEPYFINQFEVSDDLIEFGRMEYNRAIDIYKYHASKEWNNLGKYKVHAPDWIKNKLELINA